MDMLNLILLFFVIISLIFVLMDNRCSRRKAILFLFDGIKQWIGRFLVIQITFHCVLDNIIGILYCSELRQFCAGYIVFNFIFLCFQFNLHKIQFDLIQNVQVVANKTNLNMLLGTEFHGHFLQTVTGHRFVIILDMVHQQLMGCHRLFYIVIGSN